MSEETLVQIYWAIFETWSAQVDSYWARTNYFAAFELAAIVGSWVVLEDRTLITDNGRLEITAVLILVPGFVLTMGWIFSNLKSYDYHIYWWDTLSEIETGGGWAGKFPNYVSAHEARRRQRSMLDRFPSYHNFTNLWVPIGFYLVWVILVIGLVWLRLNCTDSTQSTHQALRALEKGRWNLP